MIRLDFGESQNIEYKESWRDEYLKWICGFANAQGGKLYIGVNDDCEVVGVADAKKLLEEIPNKIAMTMGLVVDVNLCTQDGKNHLSIDVKPSNAPVAFKGKFYYRSGSTLQELTGIALENFLLQKTITLGTPCPSPTPAWLISIPKPWSILSGEASVADVCPKACSVSRMSAF